VKNARNIIDNFTYNKNNITLGQKQALNSIAGPTGTNNFIFWKRLRNLY
jgi:hypothetical protein